ncbi:hypothetical protein [Pedobacter terrae]|uniref:hypothetical protein n=1 Tax=Pedobacter terrae TaxID=405671 RepID=UPI000B82D408|nr:hypothetical protein [Pedobacter terrae]
MNSLKAVTDKKQIKIGAGLITIQSVKDDKGVFSITTNNGLKDTSRFGMGCTIGLMATLYMILFCQNLSMFST